LIREEVQMGSRARLGARFAIPLAALVLGATACGTTTTMTDVWAAHDAPAPRMRSILVIAARMDDPSRRSLEDGFVSALAEHGIRATPSYDFFPKGFPSADEAHRTVEQVGFDGLLVSTSQGVTERTRVEPGYSFWNGYYGASWGGWYPGYVYTDEYVKFETSLWNERVGGKLVWSAVTQTRNPSSGKDFVASLTHEVVPALEKNGIIPKKGTPERLSGGR
jgi:hypothetical protein